MGSRSNGRSQALKFMGLDELKRITDDFSYKIGSGAYGIVFKGVDEYKEIAVKMLSETHQGDHEENFKKEYLNLLNLSHQNVVQLVGYCYQTEKRYDEISMSFIDVICIALCLEYATNGSLRNFIVSAEDRGNKEKEVPARRLNWQQCYKIIKGTCEGLNYLHNLPSGCILHLDLKPENILLSDDLTPRIADFGMARLFRDPETSVSMSPLGTWRYMPPEYKINNLSVSSSFDIYSLGVIIIELVAEPHIYDRFDEFFLPEEDKISQRETFIDNVHDRWCHTLSNQYSEQVKTCIGIALECVETKQNERPNIGQIIDVLNEVENNIENFNESRRGRKPSRWTKIIRVDSESPSSQPRRDHDDDPEVILYVTRDPSTMEACNDIREALRSLQVAFLERDLSVGTENRAELRRLRRTNIVTVPALFTGFYMIGSDGLKQIHERKGLAYYFS